MRRSAQLKKDIRLFRFQVQIAVLQRLQQKATGASRFADTRFSDPDDIFRFSDELQFRKPVNLFAVDPRLAGKRNVSIAHHSGCGSTMEKFPSRTR